MMQGNSLFSPEMRKDPYPVYREWREHAPVFWDESLHAWVLTRYDDVALALSDPRFSSNRIAAAQSRLKDERFRPIMDVLSHKMSEVDEPHHQRMRSLANKAFAHVAIDRWEPKVKSRVDALLDNIRQTGCCDIVQDFAVPLPLMVISELVGVPAEDHQRVKHWCDDFAFIALNFYTYLSDEHMDNALRSFGQFREYLRGRVGQLEQRPQDDLLSALVAVEHEGGRLSMDELVANVFLLLTAGNETTTCLVGNGLIALLRQPEQLRLLRENPGLVPEAVEEFLRYDGPVQYLGRIAAADIELHSNLIRKGDLVLAMIAAANHDPAHFAKPELLDIRRSPNHHLAFGHGAHFCIGAPLARLEAHLVFQALLHQTTDIGLDAASFDELSYQDNFNMRGVKTLPVRMRFAK